MSLIKKTVFIFIIALSQQIAFSYAITSSDSGEVLFRNHCAACHKIGRALIGPDIVSISNRKPVDWLIRFIQNSQSVIKSGDVYAIALFKEYKQVIMPENQLKDTQVILILDYISRQSKSLAVNEEKMSVQGFPSNTLIYTVPFYRKIWFLNISITFILLLFIQLFPFFIKIIHPNERKYSFISIKILEINYFLTKKVSRSFYILNFTFIVLIALLSFTSKNAVKTGRMTNQPIEFSHSTHYDTFATSCIFCHTGAVKNDFAGLPDIKNCMKCHNYITEGKKYGKKELNKLTIFSKSGRNIHWATGYRYNDYVHFNHAIHVSSAKIDCLKCHSLTDNMEIRKPDISMRWCIDCHKQTVINRYGKYYKKVIDSTMLINPLKVSETGGLDCSECHY